MAKYKFYTSDSRIELIKITMYTASQGVSYFKEALQCQLFCECWSSWRNIRGFEPESEVLRLSFPTAEWKAADFEFGRPLPQAQLCFSSAKKQIISIYYPGPGQHTYKK